MNAASSKIVFNVNYTEAGEHTYTITEKPGTEAGVTYSTESHTVKVTVADKGQGQLVATVENPNAERVFTKEMASLALRMATFMPRTWVFMRSAMARPAASSLALVSKKAATTPEFKFP